MPRNSDEDGTGLKERILIQDSILMEALAAGSEEAMGVVYDRLAPGIHAQAVRLVGIASADDVVQDTFERVWRNAARYDARRGTLEAWAHRIARNVALGLLRKPTTPALTDRVERAERLPRVSERHRHAHERCAPDDPREYWRPLR